MIGKTGSPVSTAKAKALRSPCCIVVYKYTGIPLFFQDFSIKVNRIFTLLTGTNYKNFGFYFILSISKFKESF